MVTKIAPNDRVHPSQPHRIAFYGGSFDPVHKGHLAIARVLIEQFRLDEFVFVPAFHAPHKKRNKPTSAYDRYAMLCLVTADDPKISVSKIEIEMPDRPYSVETLPRLRTIYPDSEIFFVMGADSWLDINTWREWETVLKLTNHIVVTRPGHSISFEHVTDDIRSRIVDLRGTTLPDVSTTLGSAEEQRTANDDGSKIYLTDRVKIDISATEIRRRIREHNAAWQNDVPVEVANYIEKYQIYY